MADRIQHRRDTKARWAEHNPILLEGEVDYVTDNPNQYKISDGEHHWNDLPFRGFDGTVMQETGNATEDAIMSRATVTEELSRIEAKLILAETANLPGQGEDEPGLPEVQSARTANPVLANAITTFTDAFNAFDASLKTSDSNPSTATAANAYRSLVDTVNALAMIEGEGDYATFIEHVNAVVERQKGILKARKTRGEKEEEDKPVVE